MNITCSNRELIYLIRLFSSVTTYLSLASVNYLPGVIFFFCPASKSSAIGEFTWDFQSNPVEGTDLPQPMFNTEVEKWRVFSSNW